MERVDIQKRMEKLVIEERNLVLIARVYAVEALICSGIMFWELCTYGKESGFNIFQQLMGFDISPFITFSIAAAYFMVLHRMRKISKEAKNLYKTWRNLNDK